MLETIFRALKISLILVTCSVFLLAIHALLNLIFSIVFPSIVIEVFALISMYLPFNAYAVFSSIGTVISAILSFLNNSFL